jgi:hypothetical protein
MAAMPCHPAGLQAARHAVSCARRQKAQRATRTRQDPEALERFRKALLEETLVSLIQDPSRWTPGDASSFGCTALRARSRVVHNRCPGWMCGAVMEAPLPPGRYCSGECKKKTLRIRESFRRDLHRLRMGLTGQCEGCSSPIFGRRAETRFCSEQCARRQYYLYEREIARRRLVEARRGRVCEECGGEVPVTKPRFKAKILTCSIRCYQRKYQRELWRMKRDATKRQRTVVA